MHDARRAVLLLSLVAAGRLSAQTVTNGSFENFTGTFGEDGGAGLAPGATTLTGWNIVGGDIALLRVPSIYTTRPQSGNQFLDLTGYSDRGFPKGVSQNLTGLSVGQTYTFSMWLGLVNGLCGPGGQVCSGPVQARATIGSTLQTFTHNSESPGNVWAEFGFNFVASNTTLLLLIEGISVPQGNVYLGLDNVSVTRVAENVVPEPATYGLMLFGLAALSAVRRRRHRA